MFPGHSTYDAAMFPELVWVAYQYKTEHHRVPLIVLPYQRGSPFLLIYAHGNGSDIGDVYPLLLRFVNSVQIHVVALEYPGYGAFRYSNGRRRGASAELVDLAMAAVVRFVTDSLHWSLENCIFWGASIGTGPCTRFCRNASEKNGQQPAGLILQCPYLSIREAARSFVGPWVSKLVEPMWDVQHEVRQVQCPVLWIHGQKDTLFTVEGSKLMYEEHPFQTRRAIHIAAEGTHLDLDFLQDIVEPITSFLRNYITLPRTALTQQPHCPDLLESLRLKQCKRFGMPESPRLAMPSVPWIHAQLAASNGTLLSDVIESWDPPLRDHGERSDDEHSAFDWQEGEEDSAPDENESQGKLRERVACCYCSPGGTALTMGSGTPAAPWTHLRRPSAFRSYAIKLTAAVLRAMIAEASVACGSGGLLKNERLCSVEGWARRFVAVKAHHAVGTDLIWRRGAVEPDGGSRWALYGMCIAGVLMRICDGTNGPKGLLQMRKLPLLVDHARPSFEGENLHEIYTSSDFIVQTTFTPPYDSMAMLSRSVVLSLGTRTSREGRKQTAGDFAAQRWIACDTENDLGLTSTVRTAMSNSRWWSCSAPDTAAWQCQPECSFAHVSADCKGAYEKSTEYQSRVTEMGTHLAADFFSVRRRPRVEVMFAKLERSAQEASDGDYQRHKWNSAVLTPEKFVWEDAPCTFPFGWDEFWVELFDEEWAWQEPRIAGPRSFFAPRIQYKTQPLWNVSRVKLHRCWNTRASPLIPAAELSTSQQTEAKKFSALSPPRRWSAFPCVSLRSPKKNFALMPSVSLQQSLETSETTSFTHRPIGGTRPLQRVAAADDVPRKNSPCWAALHKLKQAGGIAATVEQLTAMLCAQSKRPEACGLPKAFLHELQEEFRDICCANERYQNLWESGITEDAVATFIQQEEIFSNPILDLKFDNAFIKTLETYLPLLDHRLACSSSGASVSDAQWTTLVAADRRNYSQRCRKESCTNISVIYHQVMVHVLVQPGHCSRETLLHLDAIWKLTEHVTKLPTFAPTAETETTATTTASDSAAAAQPGEDDSTAIDNLISILPLTGSLPSHKNGSRLIPAGPTKNKAAFLSNLSVAAALTRRILNAVKERVAHRNISAGAFALQATSECALPKISKSLREEFPGITDALVRLLDELRFALADAETSRQSSPPRALGSRGLGYREYVSGWHGGVDSLSRNCWLAAELEGLLAVLLMAQADADEEGGRSVRNCDSAAVAAAENVPWLLEMNSVIAAALNKNETSNRVLPQLQNPVLQRFRWTKTQGHGSWWCDDFSWITHRP